MSSLNYKWNTKYSQLFLRRTRMFTVPYFRGTFEIRTLRSNCRYLGLKKFRHSPQVALAVTNQHGGSSIEAHESLKSHGKIGDCEQSKDGPPSGPAPPWSEFSYRKTSLIRLADTMSQDNRDKKKRRARVINCLSNYSSMFQYRDFVGSKVSQSNCPKGHY